MSGTDSGSGRAGRLRGGGLGDRRLLEDQLAVADVGDDGVALAEVALEEPQRERVLDHPLKRTLERPRTVLRVPARLGHELLRGVGELERDAALGEPLAQASELELDDAGE